MSTVDVLGFTPINPGIIKAAHPQSHYPYGSSIASSASSASSSTSSIFSPDGTSSQSSFSSLSAADVIWEHDSETKENANKLTCQYPRPVHTKPKFELQVEQVPSAPDGQPNPRRSRLGRDVNRSRPIPSLVRQSERKVNFVDNLVDSASQIVEIIWPLSDINPRREDSLGYKSVLPLRTFIQETLRRSRTSYSTLQVALYYLILVKPHVPTTDFTMDQTYVQPCLRAMQCGRRMFLSALILASKYLQDRNYSARAWSKISGLNPLEINQNEMTFLQAVDWKLHISETIFQRWTDIVLKYTSTGCGRQTGEGFGWKTIIPTLSPELNNVDDTLSGQRWSIPRDIPSMSDTSSPPSSSNSSCSSPSPLSDITNDRTPTCRRSSSSGMDPESGYGTVTLPSLPNLGLLPLQMNSLNPPAASVDGFSNLARPSICSAMSQARSLFVQRTCLDQRPAPLYNSKSLSESHSTTRRPSLARTSSFTSSPESMISDVPSLASSTSSRSSRSSRSSSISSVASATCAPAQPWMAMRATRRQATMQPTSYLKDSKKYPSIAAPIIEDSCPIFTSPEIFSGENSVPDLSNFSIGPPSMDVAHEAAQGLCELSGVLPRPCLVTPNPQMPEQRCRKRCRTISEDLSLQQKVRQLVNPRSQTNDDQISMLVLPDNQLADSFLLPKANYHHHGNSENRRSMPYTENLDSARSTCGGKADIRSLWY
ncbi:hypothetical protein FQN57_004393 [Myotisia sp. PD_48]|nr:hypothetical protein FQN57_004393 [Myotisia sp. PD_48]